MNKHSRFLRPLLQRLALAGLAGMAVACAAADDGTTVPNQSSAQLMSKVQSLIGDAECDHPTQCRVVAVGAKACGGPSGYLAWSQKGTDQETLAAAVAAQSAAERREVQAAGMLSDCRMLTPPAATCRPRVSDGKKTCQLGLGGAGRLD
ncbi:hypothetical protein [Pelomonas sp. KK5]|uniref:hypothetical protein n=1 Tax=Pelomonas sp. KK5 TaxID=1855730 RepID=UPI00117F06FC|nr:hypothetical protein [Pelomonas sp. KK5]